VEWPVTRSTETRPGTARCALRRLESSQSMSNVVVCRVYNRCVRPQSQVISAVIARPIQLLYYRRFAGANNWI